jgi:hypothetical protein
MGIGTGKQESCTQVKSTVMAMYTNLKRTCLFIGPDGTRDFPDVNLVKEVLSTYFRASCLECGNFLARKANSK